MKPFWRQSVISKFQSHIWIPQHGNAIYLQYLQMQYLPLCDGTCGPQYTLYSSPPPALLPVVESGFGLVPHKIHQHLHNSLYHSGKKKNTGIRSCAGSSSIQTSRSRKNFSMLNVYGMYGYDMGGICSWERLSSMEIGCMGRDWSYHPWRCSRNSHYSSCHCKTFLQLKPPPASRLVFCL